MIQTTSKTTTESAQRLAKARAERTRSRYVALGLITPSKDPVKEIECSRCFQAFSVLSYREDRTCAPCTKQNLIKAGRVM